MIVTILPGSADLHAVGYNEHKVSKGEARLLEMKNFGILGNVESFSVRDLVSYLKEYSRMNDRIRQPQFHVTVSCRGREMTEQQLLDFAHDYLREMGYGEEGQPLLVYSHHDTANTHLHIVTSRVAPDGRKIDHNHERRRSQAVIDKLLKRDSLLNTVEDVKKASHYSFSKLTQFKAILNSMGYESYEEESSLNVKKGGVVKGKIALSRLEPFYKPYKRDKQREGQLKAVFLKYRDISSCGTELMDSLKRILASTWYSSGRLILHTAL